MHGPTPNGLSDDQWIELRAGFLAAEYVADSEECKRELRRQALALAGFSDHEEVILWFEHDLFCQANLIYLLDWFYAQACETPGKPQGKAKLSLICIDRFPGIPGFRGLGELSESQLASLFDKRRPITEDQLALGHRAWLAYTSADPLALQDLLARDTTALPFLHNAMLRHLARFPSVKNGLGRIEDLALELVSAGASDFASLFHRFWSAEPVYGLGDSGFFNSLERLAVADKPLLAMTRPEHAGGGAAKPGFSNARFEATEEGRATLAGTLDFVELNGLDLWLGGVHLQDKANLWRWDGQRVVR